MNNAGRPRTRAPYKIEPKVNWIPHNWPVGMQKIARDRVAGLLHGNIIAYQPLNKLIESAYLQGVDDAVYALEATGKLVKE